MQTNKPILFLPRRDTHVNWMLVNPILREGELAYDFDTDKFRIGDGKRHWRDLPQFQMPTSWMGYSPSGQPLLKFDAKTK